MDLTRLRSISNLSSSEPINFRDTQSGFTYPYPMSYNTSYLVIGTLNSGTFKSMSTMRKNNLFVCFQLFVYACNVRPRLQLRSNISLSNPRRPLNSFLELFQYLFLRLSLLNLDAYHITSYL